jgi:hypothetical protein
MTFTFDIGLVHFLSTRVAVQATRISVVADVRDGTTLRASELHHGVADTYGLVSASPRRVITKAIASFSARSVL